MSLMNIVRPSVRINILFGIRASTLGNKHINVGSVEKPSIRTLNLSTMSKFIAEGKKIKSSLARHPV